VVVQANAVYVRAVSLWQHLTGIDTQAWTCGFCGREVASDKGWVTIGVDRSTGLRLAKVYLAICPRCDLPSLIGANGDAVPPAKPGEDVDHLVDPIATLYEEARRALQQSAPTAAVMAGRKVLMNVAVANGAPGGGSFAAYVDWLLANGLVTPAMRDWVDEIRELGNDANHEIDLMSRESAEELLTFVAMLLRVVYEYPEKGRKSMEARKSRDAGERD
jgi:hypothetical protein